MAYRPEPLHVVTAGRGAPVVLLHSGGMSSRQWRRLSAALEPDHRVLAVDLLGSGENPLWPKDEPFDFSLDVEAVAQLIRPLGEPAHLAGHSYGGLLALTLARLHPQLARSVAVYDPVAFGVLHDAHDEEGLADLARAERDPVFTDAARGGSAEWLERFVDYWNGPGAWRALPEPTRAGFERVGRKVFLEVASLMKDRTPLSAWRSLELPVLLLGGERSPPAARRVLALLAQALPKATLHPVAGAGHMGPITHGDEVNARIAAHVRAS